MLRQDDVICYIYVICYVYVVWNVVQVLGFGEQECDKVKIMVIMVIF